jgi:hypothetical protein
MGRRAAGEIGPHFLSRHVLIFADIVGIIALGLIIVSVLDVLNGLSDAVVAMIIERQGGIVDFGIGRVRAKRAGRTGCQIIVGHSELL